MATMGVCIHCDYQFGVLPDGSYEDGPCPSCQPLQRLTVAELAEAILAADREECVERADAQERRSASLSRGVDEAHAAELRESEGRHRLASYDASARLADLLTEARLRVQLAGLPKPGLGVGPAIAGLRALIAPPAGS